MRFPVVGDGARGPCQDGGGQASTLDPRQDQEARIVDHWMEVLLTLAGCPADEVIARPGFPGGGAETEQGNEAVAGADEVAQLGAGQGLIAEVMVAIQIRVVPMRVTTLGNAMPRQRAEISGRGGANGRAGFALRCPALIGFAVVVAVARWRQLQEAVAQHRHGTAHLLALAVGSHPAEFVAHDSGELGPRGIGAGGDPFADSPDLRGAEGARTVAPRRGFSRQGGVDRVMRRSAEHRPARRHTRRVAESCQCQRGDRSGRPRSSARACGRFS
jgi:hypothetical protein